MAEQGAQPTERVRKLLEISGALEPSSRRAKAAEVSDDTGELVDDREDDANTTAAPTAAAVLHHIVRSIVDDPDAVRVDGRPTVAGSPRSAASAPGDLGRVIGRRGRTARASAPSCVPPPPRDDGRRGRRSTSPTEARPDGLLEVGRIGRPMGVHGEVVVSLVTDRTERVAAGARWFAGDGWLDGRGSRIVISTVGRPASTVADRRPPSAAAARRSCAEPIDDDERCGCTSSSARRSSNTTAGPRGTASRRRQPGRRHARARHRCPGPDDVRHRAPTA